MVRPPSGGSAAISSVRTPSWSTGWAGSSRATCGQPGRSALTFASTGEPRRSHRRPQDVSETEEVRFETKIAVVLGDDLLPWQAINVAAFLVSGIAGTVP